MTTLKKNASKFLKTARNFSVNSWNEDFKDIDFVTMIDKIYNPNKLDNRGN